MKPKKKIVVTIVVICFFVLCFILYKLVLADKGDSKAIYGDRLDGIKEVTINNNTKKDIKNSIKDTGSTKEVNVRIQGKIINVYVTVNDEISRDDSKGLSNIILEKLNDNEKAFYDIQIFINKDAEDEQFPIIGYHHPRKEGFTWTLDR